MNTGLVKWVFRTRSYDAWNHACAAPDFYGLGNVVPIVFPNPLVNTQNFNRDINQPFVSATDFLQCNRFTNLLNDPAAVPLYGTHLCQGTSTLGVNAIRVGLFSQGDNAPLRPIPGPTSGPVVRYTLTNPPADVIADGKTVFSNGRQIKTINGMIAAVDAATGNILWQRPANDGIAGTLQTALVHETLTVGNGFVFIGYVDRKGTMVALDAKTGIKLFQFQNTIPVNGVATPAGGIESGPQVVGRRVYWGAGTETFAPFPDETGTLVYGVNRLYSFILPRMPDDEEDCIDRDTDLND